MLYKFGMAECKSVATPLDRNLKVDANSGTKACEPTQYRQLIGSLIYLSLANSCKHRVTFIWIAISEYYAT